MAGGEHLNPVDYPPLPSVNEYQNKNQPSSSSTSRDRDKQFSAAKVLNPSNSSHQNHVSIDFVVGSMPIPPITTPLVPQISVTKDFNRLSTSNPRPPSTLMEPQINQKTSKPLTSPNTPQENSKIVPGKDSAALVSPQIGKESNLALCFKGSFPCKPIHKILDTPCVSFDVKDKEHLLSCMGHIVIVKFTHYRPKFVEFKAFLQKLQFKSVFKIIEFDYKHIFIDFVVFEDCIKLWMLKNIVVGGSRGRLFMWDGDFKPAIESPIAPIWIHLPQFPFYLFDEHAMLSIASLFGKPIYIDLGCLGHEKCGVMSFYVSKDVRIKGPSEFYIEFVGDGILVERFKQVVLYGSIPDYCSHCLHLGHNLGDCKVKLATENIVNSKDVEVSAQASQCVIPLPSVFSRFRLDLKLGEEQHRVDGGIEPEIEDGVGVATQIQDQKGVIAAGFSSQDKNPSLGNFPSSSMALPLELINSVPVESNQDLRHGSSNMIHKVDDEALGAGKTDGDLRSLMEESLSGASSHSSDSSTDLCLEPSNRSSGDVGQGLLTDVAYTLSTEEDRNDRAEKLKDGGLAILGEKSDDVVQNSDSSSDSSAVPSSSSLNSISRIVDQDLLLGDDSLLSKVHVRADKDLKTTGKELDIVAETSAAELLAADQNLSKTISTAGTPSPGPISHGSLLGTSGKVLKWLGQNVGKLIQDNLQQKGQDPEVKVDATPPSKLVIKHPVTKEVIHLPPRSYFPGSTVTKSPAVLNKNAKKKLKKKQKKLEQQQKSLLAETSTKVMDMSKAGNVSNNHKPVSPLSICVASQQDWEGLDSNESKDTPFWANFHAAQEDLSQLDRPEQYPYMFNIDSEVEVISCSSDSQEQKSSSSQVSSDSSDLDLQQLQKAYKAASDSIDNVDIERSQSPSVASISPDASIKAAEQVTKEIESQEQLDHLPLLEAYHKGHFDVQVTPSKETEDASSSHDLVAVEAEQVTPSNAFMNKTVSSPPSTQISWAQEVEATDALTVGDLYETIPCDKELVNLSGLGVVSYPCPWIDSEDRDLLPEEHDLIHKLVTQYPFKFSMAGVPIERWYQVDTAKASKKFHKEQFEPP